MLNKKDLQEIISAASQHINLSRAVIEKDYYVTQIILAIADLENEYFRLIFCGGTCLAKAHRIVKRMSEDIDFKIQFKNNGHNFSKSRMLKELKEFRSQIMATLNLPGLIISNSAVRNEGKYLKIELCYNSLFSANETLRPHLLLEFTLSEIRLEATKLQVNTIIEDVIKIPRLFSDLSINCICVEETAIEKWVGLTRRIIAIERNYHPDDKTLIRHVYDLISIKNENKISNGFYDLGKSIVEFDAEQFKNQHPEYSKNPVSEIQESITLLKNKPVWKTRYQDFIDTMVYGEDAVQEYEIAIHEIAEMSHKIRL